MASPLQTGKQSVNLATPVRGSRIRRDPPPAVKQIEVRDPEERDTWIVVIGVVTFALAFFALVIAASIYSGWSPADYTLNL